MAYRLPGAEGRPEGPLTTRIFVFVNPRPSSSRRRSRIRAPPKGGCMPPSKAKYDGARPAGHRIRCALHLIRESGEQFHPALAPSRRARLPSALSVPALAWTEDHCLHLFSTCSTPRLASASARSLPGWSVWPLTQCQADPMLCGERFQFPPKLGVLHGLAVGRLPAVLLPARGSSSRSRS